MSIRGMTVGIVNMRRVVMRSFVGGLLISGALVGSVGAQCTALDCDVVSTDEIDDSLDTDCFTFTVDDQEKVNIGVQDTSTTTDVVWRLLDSSGTAAGGGCGDFHQGFGDDCGPLSVTGNPYRVEVIDANANATGPYRIGFARLTVPCDDRPVPCDQVIADSIDTSIDHDIFSFSVEEGERVNIGVQDTSLAPDASPTTDVVWRILDRTGTAVAGACGGYHQGFADDCGPLSAAGNPHRIDVLDANVNATGPYRVALARLSTPCDDIPLPCDQVVAASIDFPIEHDFFSFVVDEDALVSIGVQDSGPETNVVWRLLDNTGTGAGGACADYHPGVADDCGRLPAIGNPYRIDVLDADVNATGPYRVRYITLSGPCPAASIHISGMCRQPAAIGGLVPCAENTRVVASLCVDETCDAVEQLGEVFTDQTGEFTLALDGRAAGARLILSATVTGDAEPPGIRDIAEETTFRIIDLGPAAGGMRAGLTIDPLSEAAVQLMEERGLESYSDSRADAVIAAVRTANAATDFAGLSPAEAIEQAKMVARESPPVLGRLACGGDCDGDDMTMINELVSAVRIALSQETVAACEAADGDGSGTVMINELVEAVRTALEGCTVRAD